MTTYVVSFYKRVPREGDEALASFVINAEGAVYAQGLARRKAKPEQRGSYVEATPRYPKKAAP